MAKTIYKYGLAQPGSTVFLSLPLGAQVLDVQLQYGGAQLWVLVDTAIVATESRVFGLFDTGWELPNERLTYIATVQGDGGYVWHAFEVGRG